MNEVIASPNENGEYLISQDVRDTKDGEELCVSVSFRKITAQEYDFEFWKTFNTFEEAKAAVKSEIEKYG